MRYVIWHGFGDMKGSTPSSFLDAIRIHTWLPESLRIRLEERWKNFGQKATHYRDCVQHYVSIGGVKYLVEIGPPEWLDSRATTGGTRCDRS
jgi:hypothetical protein